VFEKTKQGITPYFTTDYDLIELAKFLLQILPITVLHEWVKGHYVGQKKEFKHTLNQQTDTLATQYQLHQQPPYSTSRKPLAPPNYCIRLIYDNSIITSKFYHILAQAMHEPPIIEYVRRKTKWSPYVFSLVDWNSHEHAFTRLTRKQKVTMAKLIPGLANTNRQNHTYYNTSNLCPICLTEEETFEHVLTCQHPTTCAFRDTCLTQLDKDLHQLNTPPL
jgi:hypothetical protein